MFMFVFTITIFFCVTAYAKEDLDQDIYIIALIIALIIGVACCRQTTIAIASHIGQW